MYSTVLELDWIDQAELKASLLPLLRVTCRNARAGTGLRGVLAFPLVEATRRVGEWASGEGQYCKSLSRGAVQCISAAQRNSSQLARKTKRKKSRSALTPATSSQTSVSSTNSTSPRPARSNSNTTTNNNRLCTLASLGRDRKPTLAPPSPSSHVPTHRHRRGFSLRLERAPHPCQLERACPCRRIHGCCPVRRLPARCRELCAAPGRDAHGRPYH